MFNIIYIEYYNILSSDIQLIYVRSKTVRTSANIFLYWTIVLSDKIPCNIKKNQESSALYREITLRIPSAQLYQTLITK